MIQKQDKRQPLSVTFKIHPDVLRDVKLIADDLQSDEDYVVEQILREYFKRELSTKSRPKTKPKTMAKAAA